MRHVSLPRVWDVSGPARAEPSSVRAGGGITLHNARGCCHWNPTGPPPAVPAPASVGAVNREYRVLPPAERPRKIRRAVRVLVLAGDEVLLFADSDPGLPQFAWWVTPGGGIDPGETERQAAVRELHEETGLVTTQDALVGPVASRLVLHGYSDEVLEQNETFWLLEVDRFEVDISGHTEEEQVTMTGHRWWPLAELAGPVSPDKEPATAGPATAEPWIWPAELLDMVEVGRTGGEPLDLGTVTSESTVAP